TDGNKTDPAPEEPIGGSIWSGIIHIGRSPYLLGLAASMLIYTMTSTWAYFQQSDLARAALKTSDERTVFLANLEIWVNSITVIIRSFSLAVCSNGSALGSHSFRCRS